jgi:hypothetical protein
LFFNTFYYGKAIFLAAEFGLTAEIKKLVLTEAVDVNEPNVGSAEQAIHFAARNGQIEVLTKALFSPLLLPSPPSHSNDKNA